MARPKQSSAENVDQSSSGTVATMESGKRLTKTAAVMSALKALGSDTKPAQIQEYVAREFGITMSVNHISNIKSGVTKKRGPGRPRGSKRVDKTLPSTGNGEQRHRGGLSLEDIETARALTRKVGPQQLHALIDLIAK
jgi:hypothetical protein